MPDVPQGGYAGWGPTTPVTRGSLSRAFGWTRSPSFWAPWGRRDPMRDEIVMKPVGIFCIYVCIYIYIYVDYIISMYIFICIIQYHVYVYYISICIRICMYMYIYIYVCTCRTYMSMM